MVKIISTYNELHLGDNLIHLNYLHKLSKSYPELVFNHYLNNEFIYQLTPLISDSNNINLFGLELKPPDAINCWIGYEEYFYKSNLQGSWVEFHLDFFNRLSFLLGVQNPILKELDLLFDFPVIEKTKSPRRYDFLIVNSTPQSNQTLDFDEKFLVNIIKMLVFKGYSVISTHPNGIVESTIEKGYDLIGVAQISNNCQAIIGIPNGPMWLTFNKFNQDKVLFRLLWLSIQKLNLGANCLTCYSGTELLDMLIRSEIL
jgi:hypothetical protein